MGCTSSTANMPESQPSTTDNMGNNVTCEKSEEPTEKDNDDLNCNTKDRERKKMPSESDSTNNHLQIVSHDENKSTDVSSDVYNKDLHDTVLTKNLSDNFQILKSSPIGENSVSLKVVVEKVLSESPESTDRNEHITNVIETHNEELDRQIEEIIKESNDSEDIEIEINEDEVKESPSPTQSEDSRATRWEALADIAAELPPSLAVDPLTGQIYSLTK